MAESRQLAVIMFTDIVGYTAVMGDDEQKAFGLLNKNRQIHRYAIEKYKGRWIKEIGDSVLATFQNVTDAVSCASLIRQSSRGVPGLDLRIGIHLGEVVFTKNDVFGDGVNIASRLQSLAPVGGIWVSEAVYKNVSNKKEIHTEFVGEKTLKNVKEQVKIYEIKIEDNAAYITDIKQLKKKPDIFTKKNSEIFWGSVIVLMAILSWYFFVFRKQNIVPSKIYPIDKSIAVLYFDNMSGDPSQEYFSDGITEEIITRLSYLSDLRVISRTSVLQYKGKGKNIKQISRELNCNNILEGSVRKSGNKIRITAQLIDASTDKHLWSDTFNRELNDIFEIQSSVAERIADKFELYVSPAEKKHIEHKLTRNMEAYDLYLRAKTIGFKDAGIGVGNSTFNRDRATEYLRQAIQLDPSFSEALALMAFMFLYSSHVLPENIHMLDSATLLAKNAIKNNPSVIDGYIALAYISESKNHNNALPFFIDIYKLDVFVGLVELGNYHIRGSNFVEAMKYFNQIIRKEPNKIDGYLGKAEIYNLLGQKDSSLYYLKKSKTLDPYHTFLLRNELTFHLFKGNVEATKEIGSIFYKEDLQGYNKQIGIAYLFKKDWKNAEVYYKKTDYRDMDWALILWKTGRRDSVIKYVQRAIDYRLKTFNPFSWDLSRLYVLKNDQEKVIYYLKKGFEEGSHEYDWIKNDPYWDEIRHTPEFIKIEHDFDKKVADQVRRIKENENKGVLPELLLKK